jgi:RNA polymerase sigma-B factor
MPVSIRIEENMHLVTYVLNKYYRGGRSIAKFHCLEVEDLEQVGMVGLVKADKSYDDSRNVSFVTYAVHKIYGGIRNYLRDNNQSARFPRTIKTLANSVYDLDSIDIESIMKKTGSTRVDALAILDYISRHPISMYHAIRHDPSSDGEITFEDVLPASNNTEKEAVKAIELRERLSLLNPKTQRICRLILNGADQSSVSKEVGISQSRISRHLSNAVKIIQEQYSTH